MPYGTPQDYDSNRYDVAVRSVGHPTFQLEVKIESWQTDVTEQQADDLIQEFVDLVAASSNFVVAGASKTYPVAQAITPTP